MSDRLSQLNTRAAGILGVVVGVAGIVIGLLDVVGLLDWPLLRNAVPEISLVLLGTLMVLAGQITTELRQIREIVTRSSVEDLADLKILLPKKFLPIAKRKAQALFSEVKALVEDNTFEVNGPASYRTFYLDVFNALKKEDVVYATSRIEAGYFWTGTAAGDAMLNFVERGGTVKRVFYVEEADFEREAVERLLVEHQNLGVRVYTVDPLCMNGERPLLLYDRAKRFAWTVTLDSQARIEGAKVFGTEQDIRSMRTVLDRIAACPSFKPFRHNERFF